MIAVTEKYRVMRFLNNEAGFLVELETRFHENAFIGRSM